MGKAPDNCITPQEAQTLFNQWAVTRGVDLKKDLGYTDTCEYTMSIEDLESYIAYIKSEAADQGITATGIRVYLGAYSEGKDPKSTIFMSPTVDGSIDAENVYSIQPYNRNEGGDPPKTYNP